MIFVPRFLRRWTVEIRGTWHEKGEHVSSAWYFNSDWLKYLRGKPHNHSHIFAQFLSHYNHYKIQTIVKMEAPHIEGPTANHMHTVISLHGRGNTASKLAPEFFQSQASDDRTLPEIFPGFKWVFPALKLRPSARFDSTEMSQWFDMWCVSLPPRKKQWLTNCRSTENPHERMEIQFEGLKESVAQILNGTCQTLTSGPMRPFLVILFLIFLNSC